MFKTVDVYVHTAPDFGGLGITIMAEDSSGNLYKARPVEMVFDKIEPGEFLDRPTIRFPQRDGRLFLEAMLKAAEGMGLTSEKEKESKGEMAAVRYHLEDLRKLVFKGE